MSFWNLSDDQDLAKSNIDTFESAGGGDFATIPNGTQCKSLIDEAKWDKDRDGREFVLLRWTVMQPEEYKNRKVFQKLWVSDDDPRAKDPVKKRDTAKRMFAAIAGAAGGKLLQVTGKPTDEDLARCLTQKPMMIRLMVWDMKNESTGETMTGNWVHAVAPTGKMDVKAGEVKVAKSGGGAPVGLKTALGDDIPFAAWRFTYRNTPVRFDTLSTLTGFINGRRNVATYPFKRELYT